jgi:4-amino-4-deoxy-L-arabinose transferase-like glycosyltransferase
MTLGSHWHVPVRSILIALGFFFLGGLSDFWLREHAASWWVTLMHDALIGVGAGLLVLLYERRQRQNMIRKIEVIRLMNHHVRNSLQVISFAASDPKREELATELRNAVGRIEWALREVLPGQREDIENLIFQPTSQGSLTRKPNTVA